LISADLSVGSLKIAAFTDVVMAESSMSWPVLSCLGVEEQPARAVNATAATSTDTRLNLFMMIVLQKISMDSPVKNSPGWLTESTQPECPRHRAWSVRCRTDGPARV